MACVVSHNFPENASLMAGVFLYPAEGRLLVRAL
jgi:hypothetical protein